MDPVTISLAMGVASKAFDAIKKGLKIMDSTAFTLSQENKLPIIVFDINKEDNLLRVVKGDKIGTLVNL